jgi:hypothetical protein
LPLNFLEGDARGIIDGTLAIRDTGTEDFFNGSFYFEDGSQATPFAQAWGVVDDRPDLPGHGEANACRWFVLGEAIDFDESLDLSFEIGPGKPHTLDRYRSVAYAYLAPAGVRR